jgi:hypothetical protein
MSLLKTAAYLLVLAGAAATAAPPDFSGTWTMNPDKGENLGMAVAVKQRLVVTQTDQALKQNFTNVFAGNTSTREVNYDLSGTPVTNYATMGDESETVAGWDGDKLVATWTSDGLFPGTQVVKTETRWLSNDGKTMSVETAREGRDPMLMVYDRQE